MNKQIFLRQTAFLMTLLFNFLKRICAYRSIIMTMAMREIQSRYVGTLAGFVWFVINPLMIILVFWFLFSLAFKIQPLGNIPFILVFVCGLIPWTMFSGTLMANTNAITRNVHLVKKMVFPTEILPIANLVASLINNGILLAILIVLLLFSRIPLPIYNFQFLYYLVALSVFTLGYIRILKKTATKEKSVQYFTSPNRSIMDPKIRTV